MKNKVVIMIILSLFLCFSNVFAKELNVNSDEVKNLYQKIPDEFFGAYSYKDSTAYISNQISTPENTTTGVLLKAINNLKANNNLGTKEYASCDEIKENGAWNVLEPQKECVDNQDYPEFKSGFKKTTVNKSLLSAEIKKIIGNENEKNFQYKSFANWYIVCSYKDNEYYCYNIEGGDTGYYSIKKLINVTSNDDEIILYDKYLYIELDNDDGSQISIPFIYTSFDKKNLITKLKDDKLNFENIDSYENQFGEGFVPTYKHTFKKDSDENYYWISTQLDKDTLGVTKSISENSKNEKIPNTGIVNTYIISISIIAVSIILFILLKKLYFN